MHKAEKTKRFPDIRQIEIHIIQTNYECYDYQLIGIMPTGTFPLLCIHGPCDIVYGKKQGYWPGGVPSSSATRARNMAL